MELRGCRGSAQGACAFIDTATSGRKCDQTWRRTQYRNGQPRDIEEDFAPPVLGVFVHAELIRPAAVQVLVKPWVYVCTECLETDRAEEEQTDTAKQLRR